MGNEEVQIYGFIRLRCTFPARAELEQVQ